MRAAECITNAERFIEATAFTLGKTPILKLNPHPIKQYHQILRKCHCSRFWLKVECVHG
jgi:hypothetical protein